ncbi:hypothetical protein LTR04_001543 [Oleoguttula sp. CCFEE 6159]|nr:hypothetical protein LTR04_001543 [Oleoguttula sp. CCFEE 6159]
MGAKGKVDQSIVDEVLQGPYFKRDIPKTTGPSDGVDEIYMGGAGSYNPSTVNYLKPQMPHTHIVHIDEIGIPGGVKEALGSALLIVECLIGRPLIVPWRTESDRPGLVGQIQPSTNMHHMRGRVCKFWGDHLEEKIECVTKMEIIPNPKFQRPAA